MIFIVGNSRSGTTLLGRILGMNAGVYTFHELHFFEQLWSVKDKQQIISIEDAAALYAKLLKNQRAGYLSNVNHTQYLAEANSTIEGNRKPFTKHSVFEFFLEEEAKRNNKRIPCEQTPRNVLYIKELLDLFPTVKIIAMVRDPRDVLLSQKGKWKRRFLGAKNIPLSESFRAWVNYHPITMAKLWNINARTIRAYNNHPSVIAVKFEDLVTNPEATIKNICSFLDIPYSSKMLSVPTIGSSNAVDGSAMGIANNNAGKWVKGGLSNSEIFYCQKFCKAEMNYQKYALLPIRADVAGLTLNAISFPIKLILAFGLNINRMKNIADSIKRRMITKN